MAVATGLRLLLPWQHNLSLQRTEYMCLCTVVVTICSVPQDSDTECVDVSQAQAGFSD